MNKKAIKQKIEQLSEDGLFPDITDFESSEIIVNPCKEQRWFLNETKSTPDELKSKNIKSTTQSLARIDYLTGEIDKNFKTEHQWSSLLTHVDLIKNTEEGDEIRLRYELHKDQIVVKWIFVNKVIGDDVVVVQIASTEGDVEKFEKKFVRVKSRLQKVSLKHLKYFLLDNHTQQIDDYKYTELEGNRFWVGFNKGKYYKPKEFVGVFVQDRFSINVNEEMVIEELIHRVKNELADNSDKMSLINELNFINDGLRVELETQYEEGGILNRNKKIPELSILLEASLDSENLQNLLVRK